MGTMLPCNVVVQQLDDQTIEVAAIDPSASMQAVGNDTLTGIAVEIGKKLQTVINTL
ncbi:MAG: DUF302 domain-containing protein [Cyclobacteriaceae bacterium]